MAALAAITVPSLFAEVIDPMTMKNFEGMAISPDGRYVASDLYGCVEIYDTDLDESIRMLGNGESTSYSVASGQAFTADGSIMIGASSECGGIGYYSLKDYSWRKLSCPNPKLNNMASAITPDGRRICGGLATTKATVEDTPTPMLIPAYWEVNEDGSYSDAIPLPYPSADFTGRMPQYVTAKCISDDGKTIIGQIRDYAGFMRQLIVYRQNEDGEWTYSVPCSKLYNPTNVFFPKWPGEAPQPPKAADFLTDSEKKAFDTAYTMWQEACNATGVWDYSVEPDAIDYMSADTKELYDEAVSVYNMLYSKWETEFFKFDNAYSTCITKGYSLTFNLLFLSPDGKTAVSGTSRSVEDPYSWTGLTDKSAPVVFNLEEDSYKVYSLEDNALPSGLAEDGTIVASVISTDPIRAVVYAPEAEHPETLYSYMSKIDQEWGYWVIDNMYHDVDYYDYELDEVVNIPNVDCTGIPRISRNKNTIIANSENLWDYNDDTEIFCYILPGTTDSRVNAICMDINADVSVLPGGALSVKGEVDRLIISDTEGRVMLDTTHITPILNPNLEPGIYVVTVINADGRKSQKFTL